MSALCLFNVCFQAGGPLLGLESKCGTKGRTCGFAEECGTKPYLPAAAAAPAADRPTTESG